MDVTHTVKSSQEQAVASWVDYLNQIRIDRLISRLSTEQINLQNAQKTIHDTLEIIDKEIVNKGAGRGGLKGMHGFIAEAAQWGLGNAKSQIEGAEPIYEWVNDDGPIDLLRGSVQIQQKFCEAGGNLSLEAILMHMGKYPDFLKNGGKYQIPSDHYEKIKWLLSIPEDQATKMPTSNGEFSLKQWRKVHDIFDNNKIPLDSVEPSDLGYKEVQRGTYERTLTAEEKKLKERNQERRDEAYQESKPSLAEGAKATAIATGVEAATTFILSIVKKRRSGKRFSDFDGSDWKEIAEDTGVGAVKGGVRGVSVYVLTNFSATPAAVANGLVTASFSIAEQAHQFRSGEIDEVSFISNSEIVCLDAAVSAASSLIGQSLIPIPVVGAIIGNAVGTMVYKIAKDHLSAKEQALLKSYYSEIEAFSAELDKQYNGLISALADDMTLYLSILDQAFSTDPRIAIAGSVELAKQMGVPCEDILDSKEKIDSYFLD